MESSERDQQPIIPVVVGIIVDDGKKVLLAKRPQHVPSPGLWEFPGGKIEAGETEREALDRELQEEVGICVQEAKHWMTLNYTYTDRQVQLSCWGVQAFSGEPHGREGQEVRWVLRADLADFTFPAANHRLRDALMDPNFSF